jgi:hypothetical protein
MINRRSVAALHRACLHRQHQPETENSGREFSRKPIEYGHDSVFRSAARRTGVPVGVPLLESAPVSEKRVALNRSLRSQGYGY